MSLDKTEDGNNYFCTSKVISVSDEGKMAKLIVLVLITTYEKCRWHTAGKKCIFDIGHSEFSISGSGLSW
jgi:hypothetical protein